MITEKKLKDILLYIISHEGYCVSVKCTQCYINKECPSVTRKYNKPIPDTQYQVALKEAYERGFIEEEILFNSLL